MHPLPSPARSAALDRPTEAIAMSSAAPSSPEQGQLVSVRARNWMVTGVAPSTLPPERLQTRLEAPQHLLTLLSVEGRAVFPRGVCTWTGTPLPSQRCL